MDDPAVMPPAAFSVLLALTSEPPSTSLPTKPQLPQSGGVFRLQEESSEPHRLAAGYSRIARLGIRTSILLSDMNQKRTSPSQLIILIAVSALVVLLAVGVGYTIGRQGPETGVNTSGGPAEAATPAVPEGTPAATAEKATAPKQELQTERTASEIAESRGVPATLEDPSGSYELVAVIEGEEANRNLTNSLRVIGSQRQRLLGLSRQYDGLPADSMKERELIAGEILAARQALSRNLQLVARTYGYTLKNEYRLVTHRASLFLIAMGEDEKPVLERVYEFTSAASYANFLKMRDDYLLLSVAAAKKAALENSADASAPEDATPAAETREAEPTTSAEDNADEIAMDNEAELQRLRDELIQTFKYDPGKNHQITLMKTVLYARPAKR